jgi:hypothetical protein
MNFSKVTEIQEQLEDKRKVLNFIIQGQRIHNLKYSDVSFLTMKRISELYNLNPISCKHKNVSEVGYHLTLDGREYEGYCDNCKTMVYGISSWNTKQ